MGKKYKNPPLVEALCEFRFISDEPWDLTLPGLIYEKVKKEFPHRQQQLGIDVQFRPTEKGLEHKIEPAPPRIQFLNEDKNALIQIAPDLLVVNQLKPYPNWERFKKKILEIFRIYKEIARPRSFRNIGLRYINIIEINEQKIELKEYFRFYPYIPNDLPEDFDSFLVRAEFPFESAKERLILTLTRVIPKNPDVISILLDLYYAAVAPEYIPFDKVEEWLEKAHERIENAFESSITDKTRELFGEVRE